VPVWGTAREFVDPAIEEEEEEEEEEERRRESRDRDGRMLGD